MRCPLLLSLGIALSLVVLAAIGLAQEQTAKTDAGFFSQKIAPILRNNCLECHNTDKARGGLDLSTRATLLEGGDKGPAIAPGKAQDSLLYKMVHGPKPKMPRGKPGLSVEQVADLVRWIDAGALWPEDVVLREKGGKDGPWWSFQPLKRPEVPTVKDLEWPRTPIDRFVLAALEAKAMKPSAEADRLTYIRRVTYDLHGLPPTPEEIDAFVKDPSPQAFEKLVDRLLASPRYGERWARIWLDLVHYADTHGYDKDKRRLWAWLYRDWVIRALNADMPYRRFVRMQVAGDVLFPDDPDGIIATGFIAAGPWDFVGHTELREGTVDKEKARNLDRDDMVANTISTFNSLTVHCARCHEHKFEPISQKEYYQLQAVFAGVERGDRAVMNKDVLALRQGIENNVKRLAEERSAVLKQLEAMTSPELVEQDRQIAGLKRRLAELPPLKSGKTSPSNGYHSAIFPKNEVTAWVQVDLGQSRLIDYVVLYPARPVDFPDTPGFGFPARFRVEISDEPAMTKAESVFAMKEQDFPNPGEESIVLEAGKKGRFVRITAERLWKRTGDFVFALAELQVLGSGKNLARGAAVTAADSIEAGLWSNRYLVDGFTSRHGLAEQTAADFQNRLRWTVQIQKALASRKMTADRVFGDVNRLKLSDLERQLQEAQKELDAAKDGAKVYAVLPITPRPIHVLHRGDVERKGELAVAGALKVLPDLDHHFAKVKGDNEGARRAALAHWLIDDNNVLNWRSIANRLWHYHFGKGIVDTPNDFGRNGSLPSHPELLDWLAAEFRQTDSFKRLHKMIVLSATYRQSSAHHPENAKKDADNRLLWRMNRQRLDAESVRDSVLAISGKLNVDKMYGPGFDLFRFKDDHSPVYDHLDLKRINAPDTWRRTVYRFVVRSVPNPFLESLDCADPNISVPVRNTTLTALQALAMLNNPFMVQQAGFFAERVQKSAKKTGQQVEVAYRLAFGRPPSVEESRALAAYIDRHGLANACRLLFNANEFMFVD